MLAFLFVTSKCVTKALFLRLGQLCGRTPRKARLGASEHGPKNIVALSSLRP